MKYRVWVHPQASPALSSLPTVVWTEVAALFAALGEDPYAAPSRRWHTDGPEWERSLVAVPDVLVVYWVDEKTQTVVVSDIVSTIA